MLLVGTQVSKVGVTLVYNYPPYGSVANGETSFAYSSANTVASDDGAATAS